MAEVLASNVVDRLMEQLPSLRRQWSTAQPFPYVVIDDFLPSETAKLLLAEFEHGTQDAWDRTPYVHQQHKLTKQTEFPHSIAEFFAMSADQEFLDYLSKLTAIPDLLGDPELLGGGCHQIVRGGYLDVHVDFNLHPTTRLYRRLNLLVYLNDKWDPAWGGALELWDMEKNSKIANIEPVLNRAVLFETSDISYHGHPSPLKCPKGVSRKSLAVYYYTRELEPDEVVREHNTIYRQTSGASGLAKTGWAGAVSVYDRVKSTGLSRASRQAMRKARRRLRGLPPDND